MQKQPDTKVKKCMNAKALFFIALIFCLGGLASTTLYSDDKLFWLVFLIGGTGTIFSIIVLFLIMVYIIFRNN